MGQKRWDRKEKRTAMTEPVKEKKEKDSNDGKIVTDKKINGQKRTIIDHFTLMRFSMSLTTSLGRPQNLEDTGIRGSTCITMSLLFVFRVSLAVPHTNWFLAFLSIYFSMVNPGLSSSGSSPSAKATYCSLYVATT